MPLQVTLMMKQRICSTKTLRKLWTRNPGVIFEWVTLVPKSESKDINDNMKCVGPFGIGNKNERGERLPDFAEENNLVHSGSN